MSAEQSERPGFVADFRLGECLVEPSLDRLSRDGTVLHLRPQLTNLLVLLARHAGRTVSKEEILATIWEGQYVAESGMTRCIAEIRQVLDDDAREPKVIQTIPKRGYRLIAPVAFLEANGSPGTPGGPGSVGAGEDLAERRLAPQPAGPEPDPGAEPPLPQQLPRKVRWTMSSSLGAALLAAITWGAGGWSRAPVVSARDTVLLADVANSTGDAEFDETLRLALAAQLGQAPFLRILPADRVRTALTRMGRPPDQPVTGSVALDVCRREGAAVLLAGSIAQLGSHYAVGLEATACRSGESVGRELLEVESKDQVLTALGTAATRLRRALGQSALF